MAICSVCFKNKRVAASKNGILCFNCYSKKNKEKCIKCNNIRTVNARIDGQAICQECNRKKDVCFICKKIKPIKKRDGDKKFCGSCRYEMCLEKCVNCGKLSPVAKRRGNSPICPECYKKENRHKCNKCNKVKIIKTGKNNPLCESCYKTSRFIRTYTSILMELLTFSANVQGNYLNTILITFSR